MQSKPGMDHYLSTTRKPVTQTEPNTCRLWQHPLFHAALIVIVGILVYCNTITSPFIFDDYPYLAHNPVIKNFDLVTDSSRIVKLGINADIKHNILMRPVAYITFALNYSLHGLDVRGYHVANLLIHCSNALLVYLLVFLLLQPTSAGLRDENLTCGSDSRLLPIFCALLFTCHPIETQAVTYIIQRFTSLVALFCLSSLVLYIYGRLCTKTIARIVCYTLSILAAVLAMKTKENAFTFPLVIVLCEFIFFSGSPIRRIARLTPFLLTMAILPINLMELSTLSKPSDSDAIVDTINLVNFRNVSSWDYLMTQFGVISTYLRLLILPINQNFDYDYQLQKNFFSSAVLAPLTLLLLIPGAGIHLLRLARNCHSSDRNLYKIIAFGCFWFFITLAVESSIVPIDDLIFEHRVYLPSAGFFMSVMAGITLAHDRLTGRSLYTSKTALALFFIVILCLSLATVARNRVWGDKITFWSDVTAKSPNKSRGHKYLGVALFERGRKTAGIEEFRTAIRLNPGNVHSHIMLGKALLAQGVLAEAARELLIATGIDPYNPLAKVVLGEIYEGMKDPSKAKEAYLAAIKISPSYAIAHIRLGELYAEEGQFEAAIKTYETAMRLYPDLATKNKLIELNRQVREKSVGSGLEK